VAAIPKGDSIRKNYADNGLSLEVFESREPGAKRDAVAPKLETVYTPLLLAMYEPLRSSVVDVIEVVGSEQETAMRVLLASGGPVATEPSSLIAFAALQRVSLIHGGRLQEVSSTKTYRAPVPVVVVNSGCGIRGRREDKFLRPFFRQ
jgi:hypothetical protein